MEKTTTDRAMKNDAASIQMEGIPVDEKQIDLAKQVLSGKRTVEDCLKEINQKYKKV